MNSDRKEVYLALLKKVRDNHPEWTAAKQKAAARTLTDQFLSDLRKGKVP